MAGLFDPQEIQNAGLYQGLSQLGAALADAGRPRLVMREGYGPGLLGAIGQGGAAFGQGVQQGRQNAIQKGLLDQEIGNEQAWQQQLAALPGDKRSMYQAMGREKGARQLWEDKQLEALPMPPGGLLGAAPQAAAAPGLIGQPPQQQTSFAPASASGGFVSNLAQAESGGNPTARSGTSSATGPHQFINSTWLQFARENPALFKGMDQAQILAARTNPQISAKAAEWYAGKNTGVLQAAGVPVNDATLRVAHKFDGPGAVKIATAPPNTPMAALFPPAVIQANPDLANKTAGQVMQAAQQRMGGNATPWQGAPPGQTVQPPPSQDDGMARIQWLQQAARINPQKYGPSLTSEIELYKLRQGNQNNFQTAAPGTTVLRNGQPVYTTPPAPEKPTDHQRDMAEFDALNNKQNRTPAEDRKLAVLQGRLGERQTVVNQDNIFGKLDAEDAFKRVTAVETAGTSASNRLMRLGQFERDLEKFTTGGGSNAQITFGQLAQKLGLPANLADKLGLGADKIAAGENIRAGSMQMLQEGFRDGSIPTQGFSNADRDAFLEASPSIDSSVGGNKAIIQVLRAMAERDAEVARAWRDWQKTNGRNTESARTFLTDKLPEIASRDVLEPILKEFKGTQAQPNTTNAADLDKTPVIEDGHRYTPGNGGRANPSNWTKVQ